MEEQTKDFTDYLQMFRRRRKLMLLAAIGLFVIAAAVALLWPPTYRSTATILIEEQEIPQDLVRSTISSYADQRIQVISQQVMTRANLMQIVEKYKLYAGYRRTHTTEETLERLRKDIKLDIVKADVIDPRSGGRTMATIAFTLSYDGETPVGAQKMANELVSLYLDENIKNRQQKTAETSSFLAEEAAKLSEHITDVEKRLAVFKTKNMARLPELSALNMQLRDRTDSELREVERQVLTLEDRKVYLEAQLAQIQPNTPLVSTSGERILDRGERLKMLQAQYASLSGVYSARHPDIVKMRREIDALQKQQSVAALEAQQASAADAKPSPLKPENPAYITLQSQLDQTVNEMRSLRGKQTDLKGKIASYELRLAETPQVEREYLELTRDHETSVARYREIKQKQMQAQISQELEKDRKGERFSLIDPPQLPERPHSPNRPGILVLGLVLSLGGGVASAAMLEGLDHSVRNSRALAGLLQVPVLAVIPYMETHEQKLHKRRAAAMIAISSVAALMVAVLLVHYFWIPLDVLWFKAWRKLNTYVPETASVWIQLVIATMRMPWIA